MEEMYHLSLHFPQLCGGVAILCHLGAPYNSLLPLLCCQDCLHKTTQDPHSTLCFGPDQRESLTAKAIKTSLNEIVCVNITVSECFKSILNHIFQIFGKNSKVSWPVCPCFEK